VTGSAGLVGSEAVSFFANLGFEVVGIENDMRSRFFGQEASTRWNQKRLKEELGSSYRSENFDIRDWEQVNRLFAALGKSISLVIHAAAQPSHEWAAREPHTDFSVNATGTLNILEAARLHSSGRGFHLYLHQQGLWRHAQPPAARRAENSMGGRFKPPIFQGNQRKHVHRSDAP
jgi:CDP-paratose 2-epimerase